MTNPASDSSMNNLKQSEHWHRTVSPELRLHLIHKIVLALVPNARPESMNEPRLVLCRDYATRTENVCYSTANNRAEYYHMIAEKIYRIQTEAERVREAKRDADVIDEIIGKLQNL